MTGEETEARTGEETAHHLIIGRARFQAEVVRPPSASLKAVCRQREQPLQRLQGESEGNQGLQNRKRVSSAWSDMRGAEG